MSRTTAGGNVISLPRNAVDMHFPLIKEVEAYWHGLRKGRDIPLRSELSPRGIERALENAFIIERIAPGIARFRLAGMHLNDVMGMEVRGMPLTAFFTPDARKEVALTLEQVFEGPEIAEITLKAEKGIGKPPLDAGLLLLPLKSDLGDVSRALGCFASLGQIGRAPRRFGIVQTRMTNLRGQPVEATEEVTTGFAESALGYKPAPRPPRGRPRLRIVEADD